MVTKLSLVGLKAMDVQEAMLKNGFFELTNYNQPFALVIPVVKNRSELVELFKKLEKYINE